MALLLVAALLAGSAGIASAATGSWPGDSLYPIKRGIETVQLDLTPASGRASLYISLAARRLDELSGLVSHGRVQADLLSTSLLDLKLDTEAAVSAVPSSPPDQQVEILGRIVREASRQQTILQAVMPQVAAQSPAILNQTLQAAIASQAVAEEDLRQIQARGDGAQTATAAVIPGSVSPSETNTPTPPGLTDGPPGQTQVPTGETHVPPGQTEIPPGQSHVPPGQTDIPPGQTHLPPGQTDIPPGQTDIPPGQTHIPLGQTHVPPGQTRVPPDQTRVPPGKTHTPPH